jgi:hypothetical protein
MIKILDVKEFRQLETGQCKAAIYFDESEADVFFSIKKKMKEGQAVQLVTLVAEGQEEIKEPTFLLVMRDMILKEIKEASDKAYDRGVWYGSGVAGGLDENPEKEEPQMKLDEGGANVREEDTIFKEA